MKEDEELNKVFESNFNKFNWGSDDIQRKNARRIITAELQERGIKYRPDGTVFVGENDVVKSKDSHTVIKDITGLLSEIGNENKLIQQANRGQETGQPGFKSSGNEAADLVAQAAVARVESLNSKN